MAQHKPNMGPTRAQHRPNMGPTLGHNGPACRNISPTWAQNRSTCLNIGPSWLNMCPARPSIETTWANIRPTCALQRPNLEQRVLFIGAQKLTLRCGRLSSHPNIHAFFTSIGSLQNLGDSSQTFTSALQHMRHHPIRISI
jgi:hypothetical protein